MNLPEPPESFREEGGRLVSGPHLPPVPKVRSRMSKWWAKHAPFMLAILAVLVASYLLYFHSGAFSSPSPDEQAAKLLTPSWAAAVAQPYTTSTDPGLQKVVAELKAWSEETGCKLTGGNTVYGDDLETVKSEAAALLTPSESEGFASRVVRNPAPEVFEGRYVGAAITVDCAKETTTPRGPFGV